MGGRFTLKTPAARLAVAFGGREADYPPPSYNVTPGRAVAALRAARAPGAREVVRLRWGLIPAWAKDPAIGNRMINARAETVASKPSFRAAFRARRCLVPADGFYEWQRRDGAKQPYYITLADAAPFAFAGLWERWQGPEGARSAIESCAILTTRANPRLAPIHDRMPVILARADHALWLDPDAPPARLEALLRPCPAERTIAQAVSRRVNSPAHDDPACIEPLG